MKIIEESDVKEQIDEMTCKKIIKNKIGKEILLVTNNLNEKFKKLEDVLLEKSYHVTIVNNIQIFNSYISKNTGLIYVDCCWGFELLDRVINIKETQILVVAIIDEDFEKIATLFAKHAYDYITTSASNKELINKTTLYMLYSAACRLNIFENKTPTQVINYCNKKESDLVNLACNYLLNNMPDYKSIDDLCCLLGTNRNTLAIAFKKTLGIGAYSWLRNARIVKARKLLKLSDINIQSICFEVGYENAANFSTTFKSIIGVSPKKYRKLYSQNNL